MNKARHGNLLGTYTFTSAPGQGVRLEAAASGFVIADAVRFTPTANQPASGGGMFYVHADHLSTPRAITRPSDNAVMWRWENTDPFGANAANDNPNGLGNMVYNIRFPGQYLDRETGPPSSAVRGEKWAFFDVCVYINQ